MNGAVHDLVGAWCLERWSLEYEDGRPSESLAYAGRYDVHDSAIYHSIEISTDPTLVGITTTRHIAREGDVLTLSGPDFRAGTARSQRIVWRRLS